MNFLSSRPYEVSSDIFVFPGHQGRWGRGGTCSMIYLNHKEQPTLIDASTAINRNRIFKMAKSADVNLTKINRIIHTHGHGDHCLGDPYFIQKNPLISVETHKNAAIFVRNLHHYFKLEKQYLCVPFYEAFMVPEFVFGIISEVYFGKRNKIKVTDCFSDDKIWHFDDFSLQTIPTPGHAPGHCSFYIPERQILFLGDLIDPRVNAKPVLPMPSSDFAELRESIIKLELLPISVLVPSHGSIIRNKKRIKSLFRHALSHLTLYEQRLFHALKTGPKSLSFLANQVIDKKMVPFENERRVMTHAILKSTIEADKIRIVEKKGLIRNRNIFQIV